MTEGKNRHDFHKDESSKNDSPGKASPAASGRSPGRRVAAWAITTIAVVTAAELVARFGVGLGDPPLFVPHPTLEYLLAPGQNCRPARNVYRTNRYGMRSPDFSPSPAADELRVLLLGDSVVNGGIRSDQCALASELARAALAAERNGPVTVANVSAGSWGPGNLAAYVEQFGTFGADAAVVVLNTDDIADVRTFPPLDAVALPTEKPACALADGTARFLPRYLPDGWVPRPVAAPGFAAPDRIPRSESTQQELGRLLDLLAEDGVAVAVLYHPFRGDLHADREADAAELFRTECGLRGVRFRSLRSVYRREPRLGSGLYRDHAHLNDAGQRVLAAEVVDVVKRMSPRPPRPLSEENPRR